MIQRYSNYFNGSFGVWCKSEDVAKLEAENERLNQTLQNQADRIAEYIKNEMEYKRRLMALEE